jgi:glycine/D-amino acid oxidase-like deaminating enzyme
MTVKKEATWEADVKRPQYSRLEKDITADVCIMGAGLTGLLSAYLLAEKGYTVAVLEKDEIGSGATSVTTGFLTQAVDTDFQDLIGMIGKRETAYVLESHGKAIDLIEHLAKKEGIECEFVRCRNTLYAVDETEAMALEKEAEALKSFDAPIAFERSPVLPFSSTAALHFENQGKYHAMKFLAGLAKASEKKGVQIFMKSEAKELEPDGKLVRTPRGSVRAEWIISATYSPFGEPAGLFLKKAMYVSYLYEYEIPKEALPEQMFEDLDNPYHYFRVDRGEKKDRLVVGGEDHRADIPAKEAKQQAALDSYVEKTFAGVPLKKVRQWTGGILEPIDGLAYIGPYGHDHVMYGFGFSGSGMTYAPIAAMIFRDIIAGKENTWKKVYETTRMPRAKSLFVKGRDYTEELFRGVVENALTRKSDGSKR